MEEVLIEQHLGLELSIVQLASAEWDLHHVHLRQPTGFHRCAATSWIPSFLDCLQRGLFHEHVQQTYRQTQPTRRANPLIRIVAYWVKACPMRHQPRHNLDQAVATPRWKVSDQLPWDRRGHRRRRLGPMTRDERPRFQTSRCPRAHWPDLNRVVDGLYDPQ